MRKLKVLSIQRLTKNERAQIEAVDPEIELTDAADSFDQEIWETWPEYACRRYLKTGSRATVTRAERDGLLADAEVIIGGWPYPLDLRSRAKKLKWFHQRPAGAGNLRLGDLWESDVVVTTSRGHGNTLPIAEYVLAGIFYFAKGLNQAGVDRSQGAFAHSAYAPRLLAGKTVCVVGVGGIGRDVGRLCAALGLEVVGTRRHKPENGETDLPEGFSRIGGPEDLHALLARSDFVAICCQLTPETERLIDRAAFNAMKPGAVLVNIARGEIVDEQALLEALDSGHLRGAALDVYVGEFEHVPEERLWSNPRTLITPHTSGGADGYGARSLDVFCENLRAYLDGRPLKNVIDWKRGY